MVLKEHGVQILEQVVVDSFIEPEPVLEAIVQVTSQQVDLSILTLK